MTNKNNITRLVVFPLTADMNDKGHLVIGGCDCVSLAGEYGTPLYVFDEAGLRRQCNDFKTEFRQRYPDTTVSYSTKAFLTKAMLRLVEEEGLDLDIVSAGELGFARAVNYPMNRVHFPGNNKSKEELEMAVKYEVGHIVVDDLYELNMLLKIDRKKKINVLLRLNPGVDPHTHKYNTTGISDSKFGMPRATWDKAVAVALAAPNLNVDGLHFHIGSGIFEIAPYEKSIDTVMEYAAEIKKRYNFETNILSVGGGYGAQYTLDAVPPSIAVFAGAITGKVLSKCWELGLKQPKLIIEPGRAIVARSGVGLYTVGVIKEIPGIRTYVSIDGGMGDNIRYPMYGFRQEALIANRASAKDAAVVTICGKYCESGDILIKDIKLPDIKAGDILAEAGSGAYAVPMQMNYNAMFRPAIVFVRDGKARLVRRRETLEDLTRCDTG
jgi:diaminopimelate decarboxylase